MKTLKKQISEIISSDKTLNLFFMLKIDGEITIKRADLESELTAPQLCQLHVDQIMHSIIENESLSLIDLSGADERKNAIYKYDYSDYPDELKEIHQFNLKDALNYDYFNFAEDNISNLFAFLIYIGDMENGIVLFKKHYPVTMIKRGTFLLFKRGERLEKFDDSDIFRMNGDFNIFAIDGNVYIKDLSVLEKNCGFNELIKARAEDTIIKIEDTNLVENISDLSDMAQDLSFAKKLSKLYYKSPVLDKKIPNERIIEFCKSNPALKNSFKYTIDGSKFILDSKASKEKFIKMLNDDYLISQLTNSYYDSIAKDGIEFDAES